MITLGLFEGIFMLNALAFLAAGLSNEAPLHRLLGPVAASMIGLIAFGVVEADLGLAAMEVLGLVAVGVICFVAPIAIMRAAWMSMTEEVPARASAPGREQRPAA